jgi:hypothetical protein
LIKNWELKDITLGDLIYKYKLMTPPVFEFNGEQKYSIKDFNINGLQAIDYG